MTPSVLASNFKNVPGAIFLLLTTKRKLHKEGGTHILRGVIYLILSMQGTNISGVQILHNRPMGNP